MQTSGDFITIKMLDNQKCNSPKKVKRYRSAFTTDQVKYLEKQFKKFPYIGNGHRKEVAQVLNIPERAVKIWFQNRRMKEKKEAVTKDIDDEYRIPKSLEFGKDQLNNANVPSANEEPRSLPLLNDTQTIYNQNMITNNSPCNMMTRQMVNSEINDSKANSFVAFPENINIAKEMYPPSVYVKNNNHSPTNLKKSPGISLDMSKKYKTESLIPNSQVGSTLNKTHLDTKQHIGYQKMPEQIMPEDLSLSRKPIFSTAVAQQVTSSIAPNNSAYLSLVPTVSPYYAEPYLSSSSIIWKPMSVLPVIPSNTSSIPNHVPSEQLLNVSSVHEGFIKKGCNCDCHIKLQGHYDIQQQPQTPQYIITAVPFQNTCAKFEHSV